MVPANASFRLPWPMSWHLIAMMMAVIVPALSVTAWLLARNTEQQQEKIEREAMARVDTLALSVDSVVFGIVSALKALSTSPALEQADVAQFNAQTQATFSGVGIDVVLRDENFVGLGTDVFGKAVAPVRDVDRVAASTAMNSNSAQFSSFDSDLRDGVAGMSIWLGAKTAGGKKVVLQARVSSDFLSRALYSGDESPWIASMSDKNFVIFARSIDLKSVLGKTRSAETQSKSIATTGFIRTRNLKDVPTLQAYTHAGLPGWRVSVAAPVSVIDRGMQQSWNRFLGIAAVLAMLAIGIASYLAGIISKAVKDVSDNARNLAMDRPQAVISTSIREISELTGTLLKTVEELSRRKSALYEVDSRLKMALEVGGMGIWEWDITTDDMVWDSAQYALLGMVETQKQPTGRDFLLRTYPDDRDLVEASVNAVSGANPRFAKEFRLFRADGSLCWVAVRASFIQESDGRQRIIGVMYDITNDKTRSEHTGALLREVSHRSKNMLALILAMARLTARGAADVQAHLREFSLRIAGLSASQDLIVDASWSAVRLVDLISAEAKAVAHDRSTRVHLAGPAVKLSPEAAQTLGMAFTELTLNAVEHGALATATGLVNVVWCVSETDDLTITWTETGGPKTVTQPVRGYGLSVVENLAGRSLGAASSVVFSEQGVRWTLMCPLRNVAAGHAAAQAA